MTNTNLNFCETLVELMQSSCITGATGKKFTNLGSRSTINNLLTLYSLMLDYKPQKTLEVGLAFGASCLALAAAHRELNHSPLKQHIAIDPFQSGAWDNVAHKLLAQERLLEYVNIYEKHSYLILPNLIDNNKKFDLIYIDGSHLFEDVFIDFYYSSKLLSESGLLAFDDCTSKHVKKVLSCIDSNFSHSFKRVNISQYRVNFSKFKQKAANILHMNQLTVYQKIGKFNRPQSTIFKNF